MTPTTLRSRKSRRRSRCRRSRVPDGGRPRRRPLPLIRRYFCTTQPDSANWRSISKRALASGPRESLAASAIARIFGEGLDPDVAHWGSRRGCASQVRRRETWPCRQQGRPRCGSSFPAGTTRPDSDRPDEPPRGRCRGSAGGQSGPRPRLRSRGRRPLHLGQVHTVGRQRVAVGQELKQRWRHVRGPSQVADEDRRVQEVDAQDAASVRRWARTHSLIDA